MKFGIDIDMCVLNVYETMRKGILEATGKNFPYEKQHQFSFETNKERCSDIGKTIYYSIQNNHENLPLMDGAFEFLNILSLYQTPVFVTARYEDGSQKLIEYLNKNLGIKYQIFFTNGGSKLDIVKREKIDCFIDDRFKTIEELSPHIYKGYLYNHPWNMGRFIPNNVERIDNLMDILS